MLMELLTISLQNNYVIERNEIYYSFVMINNLFKMLVEC